MEPRAYERDPFLRRLDTRVMASGIDERGRYLIFEDSVLYPEGGGQPADRGWVEDVARDGFATDGVEGKGVGAKGVEGPRIAIEDVQTVDGEARHYLASSELASSLPTGLPNELPSGRPAEEATPEAPWTPAGPAFKTGAPVRLTLDWQRRFDHMQQHSAQHLLSAIAEDRFGWPTLAFHLGEALCDVELDVASLGPDALEALESALGEAVRDARPIRARRVEPAALAQLEVRSRGLPDGHRGSVRLVEIADIDICTCGGTHLGSTAQIEGVKLLHTSAMRGGTRLHFVAGRRLRDRLGTQESRIRALRALVGAPEDELEPEVARRLEALKAAEQRIRKLEADLAHARAREIQEGGTQARHAVLPEGGMAELQAVARHLDPEGAPTLLLTGESGEGAFLFFAASAAGRVDWDLREDGAEIARILDGRGGGRDVIFQGKAGRLEAANDALRWIDARVRDATATRNGDEASP